MSDTFDPSVAPSMDAVPLTLESASHLEPAPPPVEPTVTSLVRMLPPGLAAPEMHAVLAVLARALAPDADEPARAAARELVGRVAQGMAHAASAQVPYAPPMPPPMMPFGGALPPAGSPVIMPAPATPFAAASRAMQQGQVSGHQLIDTLIAKLRSRLPDGVTPATPRAIQFPLVPATTRPGDSR